MQKMLQNQILLPLTEALEVLESQLNSSCVLQKSVPPTQTGPLQKTITELIVHQTILAPMREIIKGGLILGSHHRCTQG